MNLHSIERDSFMNTPNLETLHLEYNSIATIEPDAFGHLSKLKILDLDGNQLVKCPPLSELTNCEFINLAGNQITTAEELFSGIANGAVNIKLRELYLINNSIQSLKANMFSCFSALEFLNLDYSGIQTIERGAFAGLCNLRYLYMSGNRISTVDLAVFDEPDLANLRVVDMGCESDKACLTCIHSSVDVSKLFKQHFRHVVCFVFETSVLQEGRELLDELKKNEKIILN
jgi:Leucine-rich repeat (LRR) protein